MKTCLIEINIGDRVKEIEDEREGVIMDMKLMPNGMSDPRLVVMLFVKLDNGNTTSSTSTKWTICENVEYKELYPTVHLLNLKP